MILDMRKILFVGPDDRKREFLTRLQEEGVVQIEDYSGENFDKEPVTVDAGPAEYLHTAVKLLNKYEKEHPAHDEEPAQLDRFDDVADYI
ncbi:MAG: hypothetical protein ACOC2H_02735, partial [Spirochaetota bacterium]